MQGGGRDETTNVGDEGCLFCVVQLFKEREFDAERSVLVVAGDSRSVKNRFRSHRTASAAAPHVLCVDKRGATLCWQPTPRNEGIHEDAVASKVFWIKS